DSPEAGRRCHATQAISAAALQCASAIVATRIEGQAFSRSKRQIGFAGSASLGIGVGIGRSRRRIGTPHPDAKFTESLKAVENLVDAPDAAAQRQHKHNRRVEYPLEHHPSEYRYFCALGGVRQSPGCKEAVMQSLDDFCG